MTKPFAPPAPGSTFSEAILRLESVDLVDLEELVRETTAGTARISPIFTAPLARLDISSNSQGQERVYQEIQQSWETRTGQRHQSELVTLRGDATR